MPCRMHSNKDPRQSDGYVSRLDTALQAKIEKAYGLPPGGLIDGVPGVFPSLDE